MNTYTYQDFEKSEDWAKFVLSAISAHKNSDDYKTAVTADLYDAQKNKTINEYVKFMFTLSGSKVEDYTASNNKLASNFFNRLNTQRCLYSLGNGVSFLQPDEPQEEGDKTKEKLGKHFDHRIKEAAYYALIHKVSFVFWNYDHIHYFKFTEFVPLWDEDDGSLKAGIRFWRIADNKPMTAVLYTADGYIKYHEEGSKLIPETEKLVAYKSTMAYVPIDGESTVVGEENYGTLPIVPMWASRLKQSTLIGMQQSIDSYDLIKSGFANDMTDCSMIYWLVENYGGMEDEDLARLRDRMKLTHFLPADTSQGGKITPYTQEVPYQARDSYLTLIRNGLYEDFGALDVHTVAAGATNDHIDAAYQPMDENAADFEYWVGECIEQICTLAGVDDTPVFKRNRISNQLEQVQMVAQEAQWLNQQTILKKLPNISAEEVIAIMKSVDEEDADRVQLGTEGLVDQPLIEE
ncbi:MAG: phage portal protein [Eggerthellaceae bacterium]|nr:phage portal protein [Eggerthellaceae bacterium]